MGLLSAAMAIDDAPEGGGAEGPVPPPANTETIGGWQVRRSPLGRGKFGEVYEASKGGRRAALKVREPRRWVQVSSGLYTCVFQYVQVFKPSPGSYHSGLEEVTEDMARAAWQCELEALQEVTKWADPRDRVVRLEPFEEPAGCRLLMVPLCVENLETRITTGGYDMEQALAWAADVAMTLHSLHRRIQMVHRDLAPGNILVGDDGRAYVADLGLAAANNPYGFDEHDLFYLRNGPGVAPEVKKSGPTRDYDSSADVWAWGMLLYALLARTVNFDDTTRLDNLWANPEAGVARLVRDIDRAWGGDPVPDGALQALRASVCAVVDRASWGTLLHKLAGCGVAAAGEYIEDRLSEEEKKLIQVEDQLEQLRGGAAADQQAEASLWGTKGNIHLDLEERAHAERVLTKGLELSEPYGGLIKAAILSSLGNLFKYKDEFDLALQHLQEALSISQELSTNPLRVAACLNDLGSLHVYRKEYDLAEGMLEDAWQILTTSQIPPNPLDLAAFLTERAHLRSSIGRYDEARQIHEQALGIRRATGPEGHLRIATSLNNLGNMLHRVERHGEALEKFGEALRIRRGGLPHNHPELASSLSNLAREYRDIGQYDKALPLMEEALSMRRKTLPKGHESICISLCHVGWVHVRMEQGLPAVSKFTEALKIRRLKKPDRDPSLIVPLTGLAAAFRVSGKYEDAIRYASHALKIGREALQKAQGERATPEARKDAGQGEAAVPSPDEAVEARRKALQAAQADLAKCLTELARAHRATDNHQEAVSLLGEALGIRREALGVAQGELATTEARKDAGQGEAAVPSPDEAVEARRKALQAAQTDLAKCLTELARAHRASDNHQEAVPLLGEALGIRREALQVAQGELATAEARKDAGQGDLPSLEQAVEARRKALQAAQADLAKCLTELARAHKAVGKHEEEVPLLEEALKIRHEALQVAQDELAVTEARKDVAESHTELARALKNSGKYSEAVPHFEAALTIRIEFLPDNHPDIAKTVNELNAARRKAVG
jgi:tetratricopeptide (TPR) repeat protein